MAENGSGTQRRRYFKYGCFGCLGAVGLFILVIGGIAGTALVLGPPEQEFVQPEISRRLPGAATPMPGSISSDRGDDAPLAGLAPPPAAPGRLILDLHGGRFELLPGEPGQPVRIEGDYNAGGFDLQEEFDPDGEDGWTYRISFNRGVSWVRMLHGDQHQDNLIRITVPRGVPMALEGDLGLGEFQFDLSGLWLVSADLQASKGDFAFDFGEPVPQPLEHFELDASMGSFRVGSLGNASPASVRVRGKMGEVRLDLRGAWQNDAVVSGRWRMGEYAVRVPEGVNIDTDGATVFLGAAEFSALRDLPPADAAAPTLKLELSGSMGEMSISR